MFELRFDYDTGRLKAIDIVQSTGSRLLDHDAIAGLKEWKAKPHTVRVMRIPITFTFTIR
jgi:TonB family protein